MLSPDEEDELGDMISSAKKRAALGEKSALEKRNRDEKIKNNPLESYNPVVDGRADKILFDGSETWASKQLGLSAGSKSFLR